MRNSKITSKIWGILGLAILVGAAGGGFLYLRLRTVASAYERLFDHDVRNQDLARVMQLTFKKQVQEWKDLLLRGHDPEAFQKYNTAFHAQADSVRQIAGRHQKGIGDDSGREVLNRFVEAHGEM